MYLAIDYGKNKIGLASGQIFPKGQGTVINKVFEDIVDHIALLAQKVEAEGIVVGYPTRSQGEKGTLAGEIEIFAKALFIKTGLPVYFQEENFTSEEAKELLSQSKAVKYIDPARIDEIAAVLILERFLERKQGEEVKPEKFE